MPILNSKFLIHDPFSVDDTYSNLAKDCIQIVQTTKLLPLNLIFRQISLAKLRNYLRQKNLEESFKNLKYEDAVRKRQIESDFEENGFYTDHFGWIPYPVILIKYGLHALGKNLQER